MLWQVNHAPTVTEVGTVAAGTEDLPLTLTLNVSDPEQGHTGSRR